MADQYTHADGSRECRPVAGDPNNADLFDGTDAAPKQPMASHQFTSEQVATLTRLAMHPVALLDINAARVEQITTWGHSDEADALEASDFFARKARDYCNDAVDHCRFGGDDIPIARMKLAKAAALAMAGIDRLDALSRNHQPEEK